MSKGKNNKTTESGSIFTVLMGGIAMVALVSLAAYQTISGPVASASRVTQLTMAKSQLASIGSMTIMDAANQTGSGDCDSDGHIEPRPWRVTANAKPTNGGLIPLAMGAPTIDPWGMDYGYCAWDVGPISADPACGGGTGMLDGANDTTTGTAETLTVLAIISAGPDRSFDTTCNNYVDASTDLITTDSDDIIKRFTYSEASSATGSLWKLKAGDASTAALDKNLEIGNDINFDTGSGLIQALSVNTTGKMIAGGGLDLSDETVVVDGDCTGGATAGLMRFNSVLNEAQLCLSDGTWDYVSTAGVRFPILAPDGTVGAPKYSFANYTDAGFYHDADGLTLHTATAEMNFGPASGTEFHVTSTGGFQMGNIFTACDSSTSGVMRYDDTTRAIAFCNGESWTDVSSVSGGSRVAAADSHSCTIKPDQTAWCWGNGGYGKLGNGPGCCNDETAPHEVYGGHTWKSITGSEKHSCGIQTDGSAWCWGSDWQQQIGNSVSGGGYATPQQVDGNSSWALLSAGRVHTCGIKTDGSAWCWGSNNNGQLGDGTTNNTQIPVEVSGSSSWTFIDTSSAHTCGIKTDGSAWCWGDNGNGRLGTGDEIDSLVPVEVSGNSTWKSISTGGSHTCGIKTDGSAWCWGNSANGRLGAGWGIAEPMIPNEIRGNATWKQISLGDLHSCAMRTDNTVWCWGYGYNGQVGYGGTSQSVGSPVEVSGGYTWKEINMDRKHSCGIQKDDSVWCWGQGSSYKLGTGDTTNRLVPTEVTGL